jgi:histidine triad (HIT) family protein
VAAAPGMSICVFCQIVAKETPARIVAEWSNALAFSPRSPVVSGHVLVIPKIHVMDFAEDPKISGDVMERAAQLARIVNVPMNLITSWGVAATQTVFHLHLHLVPRKPGDGLLLPWSNQPKET